MTCPRCQTEYEDRCAVCEGTPLEWAKRIELYYDLSYPSEKLELAADIAARDAAMLAKGEEIGRRKGLAEAEGCVVMCQENCNCSDRTIAAIRAAADALQDPKQGEEEGEGEN